MRFINVPPLRRKQAAVPHYLPCHIEVTESATGQAKVKHGRQLLNHDLGACPKTRTKPGFLPENWFSSCLSPA
ncbi:hypothetical protein BaRGS_00011199 [Batillaria attramentaria]|uniref:Uncharacterized protein n=1 Tax=Batillaria attramentaria TaxID=370345 RepID=A0ABD0LEV0_9CAEN